MIPSQYSLGAMSSRLELPFPQYVKTPIHAVDVQRVENKVGFQLEAFIHADC